jgi:hypothetical protein
MAMEEARRILALEARIAELERRFAALIRELPSSIGDHEFLSADVLHEIGAILASPPAPVSEKTPARKTSK